MVHGGGDVPSPEENADLPDFTHGRAYLLLRGVYGDYPQHKSGSHLNEGVLEDAIWQSRWRRISAHSANWYATHSVLVGRRFTAILAAEWRGVLGRSWKYNRPLVFAHVVLMKTLGIHRAKEIRERITRWMDLWERGLHAGLVGDDEAEGATR